MMRQYWELKSRYEGCMLFFRLGDFYEMFFDDAERASRLLGLTLTSRDSGGPDRAPMCGVPFHSAQQYIGKLLKLGEKVALCEQMEDPRKARGLVKREVVRVLTPGTVVEAGLLEERRNNWIAAVATDGEGAALAALDLSTGEFLATEFEGAGAAGELRDELERLRPVESLDAGGTDAPADADAAREALLRHFRTASLEAFGCERRPRVQRAAAQALGYAKRMQRGGLEHVDHLATYEPGAHVRLDPFTLDALEVVDAREPGDAGSTLLAVLDHSTSAMGARALRSWLLRPLAQAGPVLDRLDAVEWLVGRPTDRAALRAVLSRCADLERVGARLGGR
ncbi:MAG: DNA mismatch repair protein MutS, partial [bacterium]